MCLRNPARRRRRGEQSTDGHPALVKGVETTVLVPSRPNTRVFFQWRSERLSGVGSERDEGKQRRLGQNSATRAHKVSLKVEAVEEPVWSSSFHRLQRMMYRARS